MSFGETQAAVFVLQPVFSDGRGGLTVRGPPIDSVEGRRLAFSISWGGDSHSSHLPASILDCWLLLCSSCVVDFIDLTLGLLFFLSVVGKKMHGNLAR